MSDPNEALLQRLGENVNLQVDLNVRKNLMNLVGEETKKRIVKKSEHSSEILQVELPPLDPAEQDDAQLQIIEMHPLANTPLHMAFPTLCCCLGWCFSEKEQDEQYVEKMENDIHEINNRLNDII